MFLSACHSEGVSGVFLNSGATHVICIEKEESVMDEACIIFSRAFYSSLFGEGKTPCQAFHIAS